MEADIPEWLNLFVWYGLIVGNLPLLITIIAAIKLRHQYKRTWLLPIIIPICIWGFFALATTAFVLPFSAYMIFIYPAFRGYGMEPGILAFVIDWLVEYWWGILLFSEPIIEIALTVGILKLLLRRWDTLEPALRFSKQTVDPAIPS